MAYLVLLASPVIQGKPRHAEETPRSSECRSQGDEQEQGKNRRRGALQDGAELARLLGSLCSHRLAVLWNQPLGEQWAEKGVREWGHGKCGCLGNALRPNETMCTPSIPGDDKAGTLETLGFCPFLFFFFSHFLTFIPKGAGGELAFAEHHSAPVDAQYFQKNHISPLCFPWKDLWFRDVRHLAQGHTGGKGQKATDRASICVGLKP